ncbi:hypothetical protein GCM10022215_33410 [Nocardioides fonticola]|uniref:Uncharacterized protein n=1 Tax=Nocardioides fonticola TaxID=450363 RepID=A0ABP7XT53_9ACTN
MVLERRRLDHLGETGGRRTDVVGGRQAAGRGRNGTHPTRVAGADWNSEGTLTYTPA